MIRPIALALTAACLVNLSPICCAAYAAQAEPEVVDGVAAVVNGDVITYSQVRGVVMPREKLLRAQFTGDELIQKVKEARQAALNDLIDRQLIIQAFKQDNYQIPDHFVEDRMHDIIRTDFGGDRNTFIKTLEAQNFTIGEFKKMEMEKMIVQAMRGKNVKLATIASPVKVEQYYKEHRDEFTSKEQIKLRLIMIPGHFSDGEAAAQKAMANEIFSKLVNGAQFEQMAQLYSEDSTREKGGDWGWVDRKTLAAPLEKAAFRLAVGKISNVIDFSGNYYILKVEDRHGGDTKSLEQARADIEKKLIQLEAQNLQERWIASLRSKAYIKTF
ncbi:MAG TPA: peptidylprolyl isomerase [Chthoniobacterales bacterium]|jgi:peptidyl-prolyl cis-trans isomerase SurA|nr:peptidylprolyl isomerase [Chthoniobacterales bacterium]